ncbi:hypothetical protein B0T26DRAFT_870757 [Lasiosphaeria miniovina]|uniref:Uncharacterized protein n=1 Tax=Lasiosphaeria miniovina TaxID=1954250 RepID=A0AA40AVJ8_9PEZI|nr:uncharacterized protein B0T26DRAFT_870757 [Lasiosphaeria miniovina]KAK0722754.1 hypothetical protein B0T26DRAFT_870757 [Lasiosphaeria miniovina]
MEQPEVFVEEGFLAQDYDATLDATIDAADVEVDEFDFQLDGVFETENVSTEANIGDSADVPIDFEIGYDDDEVQAATEEISTGYRDEISYDDEEPTATEPDVAVAGGGGSSTLDLGVSMSKSEEHTESFPEALDNSAQSSEANPEAPEAQDQNVSEHIRVTSLPRTFESQGEETVVPQNSNGDDTRKSSLSGASINPVSGVDELDQDAADVLEFSHPFPVVEVLYNECRYSLFGSPNDDPDSYFLSDLEESDGPLSGFLNSIRDVLGDDISPLDELLVRIDSLNLEFGENSRPKFLTRTFREIVHCHIALVDIEAIESQPLVLRLSTRLDCEERFIRLLEDAGIEGAVLQSISGSEVPQGLSQGLDERQSAEIETQEQVYDEGSNESHTNEYGLEADTSATHDIGGAAKVALVANEGESGDNHPESTANSESPADEFGDEYGFEAGTLGLQGGEGFAELEVDVAGQFDDNVAPEQASHDSDLLLDFTKQPFEEHGLNQLGDEVGGVTDQLTAASNEGGSILGENLHGNTPSFISSMECAPLASKYPAKKSSNVFFDDDGFFVDYSDDEDRASHTHQPGEKRKAVASAGQPAIKRLKSEDTFMDGIDYSEDDYEPFSSAAKKARTVSRVETASGGKPEAGITTGDDANVGDAFTRHDHPLEKSDGEYDEYTGDYKATENAHTSATSTINGDEIDYDENDLATESFMFEEDTHDEWDQAYGTANDEIDWENDGDGESVEPNEPSPALTPSSLPVKRSRLDGAEGLADESAGWIHQLVLEAIIETKKPNDYVALAEEAALSHASSIAKIPTDLQKERKDIPL